MAGKATERAPTSSARPACCGNRRRASRARLRVPPCQTGPTVWMMKRAGRSKPSVTTAWPGGHSPMARQAACRRSAPAARWMAPSTPPPPRSRRLAALTTASTRSTVMSPLHGLQQWRHRVGYPAVVDAEEAGTSLSSDVVLRRCGLALVLAPVREGHGAVNGRRAPGVAGVRHLLDRERRAAGRDVEHDRAPCPRSAWRPIR